ncbi:peptidase S41 [Bacteroidia bacterium]|nr:peptidase S41 [Bacteroidia bacterium]
MKFLLAFSLLLSTAALRAESNAFKLAKGVDVYFSVLRNLDMGYVDTLYFDKLIRVSIEEMLNSLDPYTELISEEKSTDFDFSTTGQYGGVGMLISSRNQGGTEIMEVYEGTPAHKAQLSPGDKILAIDNLLISDTKVDEVSKALKGKIGSSLQLKVLKYNNLDTITLSITREKIHLPAVPYFAILPNTNIGYIAFSTFTKDCSEEVKKALVELKKQGAAGIVLDLRNNTGGLLEEAVKIVNFFVDKGQTVVSIKGRVGGETRYTTKNAPIDTRIPLTVLINRQSASAAEIVAGALQDIDRAVIVGQKSYGKGLVQSVLDLPFNERIKLTTAKYYTPSGRCVQAINYHTSNGSKPQRDTVFREFKTANGRTVYDAGGVTPDTLLQLAAMPSVLQAMYEKGIIFDYANFYRKQHSALPANFSLTDANYQQLIDFVKAQKFTYQSTEEQKVKELEQLLSQKSALPDSIAQQLASLKAFASQKADNVFNLYRTQIQEVIEEEIASRYLLNKGRYQYMLRHDTEVTAAKKILQSPQQYNGFLKK